MKLASDSPGRNLLALKGQIKSGGGGVLLCSGGSDSAVLLMPHLVGDHCTSEWCHALMQEEEQTASSMKVCVCCTLHLTDGETTPLSTDWIFLQTP